MSHIIPSPLLRWSLAIDAVASVSTGLPMALAATALASVTALPAALLSAAGAFVTAYGLIVALLSRRRALPRWMVLVVVVGNGMWALGCLALAFGGWLAPSAAGVAFLLAQGIVVGGLAEAQWIGLRRSTGTVHLHGAQPAVH